MINQTDLAWLAGFIDGEGSIHLHKAINRKGNSYWSPRFAIYNNDIQTLENSQRIIYESTGLLQKIHERKPEVNMFIAGRRPSYFLTIGGRLKIQRFFVHIIPYLVSKKKLAEEVLRMRGALYRLEDREGFKESLYEDYIERKLSATQIAKKYNNCPKLVISWLKHFGIPTRSRSEATILRFKREKLQKSRKKESNTNH